MSFEKLKMHLILRWISQADSARTADILDAALAMQNLHHPHSDTICLTLPKSDPQERQRLLTHLTQTLL